MNGIQFFEDVFEERLCAHLLNDARERLGDSREYQRSNFHWDQSIRRHSGAVLVRDYDGVRRELILQQLRNTGVIQDREYSVMGYAWTRLSYIPWHNDAKYDHAVTVYLNDVWDADLGGLFLYRDEEQKIHGFAPKFNWALSNRGGIWHSTTPVMLDAPEPGFTIQLFATR